MSVLIPDGKHDASFKVLTSLALVPKTRIHIISSEERPRTRYSRLWSSYCARREGSEREWFDQIREVAARRAVDVILPVHVEAIRFACRWREQLAQVAALPLLPELEAFDLAQDKGALARFLGEHGLPSPITIPVSRALDDAEISFPSLIKPRRLSGGRGIEHCGDRKTLEDFVTAHSDALDNYIVQELVTGRDFAATALCEDGRILPHTLREFTRPRPNRFGASCSVRYIDAPELFEIVEKLMSVLNWSGIANVGFKYNARTHRFEVLDFNPRFGGNTLSSTVAGINFPYLACLIGLKMELPESRCRLQEYMEIREALKTIVRRAKGGDEAVPNFIRETNLPFILRDPVPYLNRSCDR